MSKAAQPAVAKAMARQGILALGVLRVLRGLKFAENTAQRKNS
jgi:hypothetical protein